MMKFEKYHLERAKSVKLFGKLWIPEGQMATLVIMVHGIGEHSGCYDEWAKKFVGQSMGFLALDMRGHGLSTGIRGHASLHDFKDDLRTIVEDMRQKFPDVPIVLLGHSMGGGIVLNYGVEKNMMVQGVIVSSPWLKLANPPWPILVWLAKVLSHIVPWLTVRTGIMADQLAQDGNTTKSSKTDPLLHKKISVKLFSDMWINGMTILHKKYRPEIPILLMHGTTDSLVSFKAAKSFSKRNRKFIHFKRWIKMPHDLFNDSRNEMIFKYVIFWLSKQIIKNGTVQNHSTL